MHQFRIGLASLLLVLLAACESVPTASEQAERRAPFPVATPTGAPEIGPWGYPLDAIDPTVDPGDDFFAYANGEWLKSAVIRSDLSGTGFQQTMRDRNERRLKSIMFELQRKAETPNEVRIRNLYQSYIQAARETLPPEFLSDLDRLRSLSTYEDVAAMMADVSLGIGGPFRFYVSLDPDAPRERMLHAAHAGLTLPDRVYYLEVGADIGDVREDLLAYFVSVLSLTGSGSVDARAQAVFDLETEIAKRHWPRADRRLTSKIYNRTDLLALSEEIPKFPWSVFAEARGFDPQAEIMVNEDTAFPKLAKLFAETPIEVWRDYLITHYFTEHLGYLGEEISAPHFELFNTALRGVKKLRTREERALLFVDAELDQAVGEIYVQRFFSEDAKRQMEEMFENIRLAMRKRIAELDWMTPQTKIAAVRKLSLMRAQIGYPEVYRDYGSLTLEPDNLIGNIKRLREFNHSLNISRLADPKPSDEWSRSPQTVNAFYTRELNTVMIPAGYIQSPLFDPNADPAINYGAIGTIIGHEIAHAFDDQGSRFEADGSLSNWWRASDRRAFDRKTRDLVKQYDQYEALPGLFVNGRQTLGENIGDLAGTEIALMAYQIALDGDEPAVLDGFTGMQRFFLGRAQARRFKRTDESLRRRLLSRPHAPMRYRVNGVVRNMDAWYRAFEVDREDQLYLPRNERVRIW